MRQSLPLSRHGSAAIPDNQSCRRHILHRIDRTLAPQHIKGNNAGWVRALPDTVGASADRAEASFSGRASSEAPRPHGISHPCSIDSSSLAACAPHPAWSILHTAWRATLATAASACVLQGSFAPLMLTSTDPSLNPPTHTSTPIRGPTLDSIQTIILAASASPAASAAAEPHAGSSSSSSSSAGNVHDKVERLHQQFSTPDVAAMREVSEELAAGGGSQAVTAAAARAAAAAAGGREGKGGAVATRPPPNPNARLKAADLASLLHISTAQAKSIMASERQLGRLTHGSAAASFETLRELLGLGSSSAADEAVARRRLEAAGAVVVRQPRVLLVAPGELRERFGELQTLLSIPAPLARSLVSSQPSLLATPPPVLRSRLSALCR
ncbi:hypothetical protein Agub_g11247, partial [Astrephomene gubernaculifera]